MKQKRITLNRLNESHDEGMVQMPQEVLDMTVGEMLDMIEKNDTDSDDRYEKIEDAIFSCLDCLMPSGYDSDQSYSEFGSVEGDEDGMFGSSDDESGYDEDFSSDLPSYSDMPNDDSAGNSLDDFNF